MLGRGAEPRGTEEGGEGRAGEEGQTGAGCDMDEGLEEARWGEEGNDAVHQRNGTSTSVPLLIVRQPVEVR